LLCDITVGTTTRTAATSRRNIVTARRTVLQRDIYPPSFVLVSELANEIEPRDLSRDSSDIDGLSRFQLVYSVGRYVRTIPWGLLPLGRYSQTANIAAIQHRVPFKPLSKRDCRVPAGPNAVAVRAGRERLLSLNNTYSAIALV